MAYVITEICVGSKDASCYEACPVDAIGPNPHDVGFTEHEQLFIDAAVCIDCGACDPVCPVEAIYREDELPEEHRGSIAANKSFFDL
jgi:NAD-dependent dihydropyrimidine dehydrogenase PreA subunit